MKTSREIIPKEAIEKAISGGWHNGEQVHIVNYAMKGCGVAFGDKTDPHDYMQNAAVALDPTFWQALGKALGWDTRPDQTYPVWWMRECQDLVEHLGDDWQNAAHTFYDLILTGDDTDKFWQEILKA